MDENNQNPTPVPTTTEKQTTPAPEPVRPKGKYLLRTESYHTSANKNVDFIKKVLPLNFISALLCTIFFSSENEAYLGFFFFTILISIILLSTLLNNSLIQNKKAFLWLIPINLLSFSNALFSTNTHYLNILVVHILFSIMFVKATNTSFIDIFDIRLVIASFSNFFPSLEIAQVFSTKIIVKNEKRNFSTLKNIFIGLVIAVPFVFFVLILLSVADNNFAKITENLFTNFNIPATFYKVIYFLVALISFYIYSCNIIFKKDKVSKELPKADINSVILSTFLFCLNALYILFLFLQAKYFITGGLFALPDGFTYSQYANDGFFATFIVSLLNFAIILFITEFTKIKFDNIAFKLNFNLIFVSNILLIFTALVRLYIYIDQYGYTVLRQSAFLGLVLELIIMVLLILKLTINIKFYKLAMLSIVTIYLVQAYTANDYINTYLNIKKFDISLEDLEHNNTLDNNAHYTLTDIHSDKSIAIEINTDSCAFMWHYAGELMAKANKTEFVDENGYPLNVRLNNLANLNFLSQTILESKLEKNFNE